MLALAILVIGAGASFYCYSRLMALTPMSDPAAVSKTEATIHEVITPMVKKDQTTSDVISDVKFSFVVDGKTIEGGYLVRDMHATPKQGAKEPVAYLTRQPEVFLRAKDYDDLPRQLKALRIMMWGFALIAMVLPFGVMKHGA